MTGKTTAGGKRRRWLWVGGALAILALVLAAPLMMGAAGARQAELAAAQDQSGEIVAVARGDLSASATASGNIEARREVRLSLETAGTVEEAQECLKSLRKVHLQNRLKDIQQKIARSEKSGEKEELLALLYQKQDVTKQILSII